MGEITPTTTTSRSVIAPAADTASPAAAPAASGGGSPLDLIPVIGQLAGAYTSVTNLANDIVTPIATKAMEDIGIMKVLGELRGLVRGRSSEDKQALIARSNAMAAEQQVASQRANQENEIQVAELMKGQQIRA